MSHARNQNGEHEKPQGSSVTRSMMPHIAARIFNTPLLVHPQKLDAIVAGLGQRVLGLPDAREIELAGGVLQLPPSMFSTRRGKHGDDGSVVENGAPVINGVAVISVMGVMAHRTKMTADSDFILGYDTIAADLQAAVDDPESHSILMVFDSPGGEVQGAFELAARIRDARLVKPVRAIADGMACSAAYLAASAADQVAITPTAYVGSVGVVMRHVDMSRALENEGLRIDYIYAGSKKIDGHSGAPLPASVRADFQSEIDTIYSMFTATVADHRQMSVDAVRATEAATYMGEAAIKAGFADRIATVDQMIAELAALRPARSSGRAARNAITGAKQMADVKEQAAIDEPSNVFTQADMDAMRAEGEAVGLAAGRTEGAKAERERIQSVEAQSVPGHEALIESLKFDGKTSGPEAAVKVLAAEKEIRAGALAAMHAGAPMPIAHAEAPEPGAAVTTYTAPAGYRVNAQSAQLHAAAKAYAEEHKCTFALAVKAVQA